LIFFVVYQFPCVFLWWLFSAWNIYWFNLCLWIVFFIDQRIEWYNNRMFIGVLENSFFFWFDDQCNCILPRLRFFLSYEKMSLRNIIFCCFSSYVTCIFCFYNLLLNMMINHMNYFWWVEKNKMLFVINSWSSFI
jgi:hypothetical protein